METGLRILAFAIDSLILICFGVALTLTILFSGALIPEDAGNLSEALALGWVAAWMVYIMAIPLLLYILPVLYFAGFTAWRGRTLGKMICQIRVVDSRQEKPTFPRAVGRASLKLVAIVTNLGALIAFIQLLLGQSTWYDTVCGTDVECYAGLTETQKQFRKHHGRY